MVRHSSRERRPPTAFASASTSRRRLFSSIVPAGNMAKCMVVRAIRRERTPRLPAALVNSLAGYDECATEVIGRCTRQKLRRQILSRSILLSRADLP